jgi:hypothetical protein
MPGFNIGLSKPSRVSHLNRKKKNTRYISLFSICKSKYVEGIGIVMLKNKGDSG